MPWSETALTQAWIFEAFMKEDFPAGWGFVGDWHCAVFNNAITPRKALAQGDPFGDVQNFQFGYNPPGLFPSSQEVRGNPLTAWPPGGPILAGTGEDAGGFTRETGSIVFRAGPAASNGPVTMLGMHGDVVLRAAMRVGPYPWDNLVSAFHWFGGAVDVNSGFFAVIWGAAGVMRIDTAGYGPP